MGSSAISPIIKGETGPTGPKGSKGSIGPTGVGVGFTGITGPRGFYIVNSVATSTNTVLFPSNWPVPNPTPFFLSGTKGPTGYTGTMYGENIGSGLTLYSAINGFTLSVRGLTFVGNLRAEATAGTILITPLDVYYGVTLSNTVTNDRVTYSKTSSVIDTSMIRLGKTHSNFIFSNSQGITPGSFPVYSEISGNVIEISSGENNVILGLTAGSIYHIHTPIGISGFTLNSSLHGDNELISFTLLIEGGGFTQFPSNVYFEDTPYSSVFGCGMNIMNLMTYDKGQNWFATITDRGYGVNGCPELETIGSCCYIGGSGDRECKEYVTQEWCAGQTLGIFNALVVCDPLCGKTAICCSSGKCVGGVSQEECEYFLGKYYEGLNCLLDTTPEGDNTQRLCYDPTEPPVVCCTGGTCIDSVTSLICNEYYHGTSIPGKCCEIDCGTLGAIRGACCVEGESPECSVKTPTECSESGGFFYGNGTICDNVNCCFESEKTGYCCIGGNCVENITQANCSGQGTWHSTQLECSAQCSPEDPIGDCCIDNIICSPGTYKSDCEGTLGNVWYPSNSDCNGNCPSSTLVWCCSSFGVCAQRPQSQCGGTYYTTQSACQAAQQCGTCCANIPGIGFGCYAYTPQTCSAFTGVFYPNISNCGGSCP
jgi:hypothetical protein